MTGPLALESAVRCGVMLGGGSGEQVLELSRRIESLGFDSIFVGDHVSFHFPIPTRSRCSPSQRPRPSG